MSKQFLTTTLAGLVLGALVVVAIFNFFYTSDTVTGSVIANDVQKLEQLFTQINNTCQIISFDYQKNPINFLNVKSFVGSEVGSMNLAYPDRWQGPYLHDNPTVQGKEYMVVSTQYGFFITPGEGVELPNDKIIGQDIILDENADIPTMMQDDNFLSFKGRSLAARIDQTSSVGVDPSVADLSE